MVMAATSVVPMVRFLWVHRRIKEVSTGPGGRGVTYYLGNFEEHGTPAGVLEQRHSLGTPEGPIGIYTLKSDGSADTRYWHQDQAGPW